jgi:fumarylacetoacetase
LGSASIPPPARDPEPLPYLRGDADRGLDVALKVRLNSDVVSRPPYSRMYGTPAQMLAHMTADGASLRTRRLLRLGDDLRPTPGPARLLHRDEL